MGSSTKKKKEKKKDFQVQILPDNEHQKPKLKVGKGKVKPANFTETSFKAKTIVVNQQALAADSPDTFEQFTNQLSLAASSRSDSQRREALSYLTNHLSSKAASNSAGTLGILTKVLPLMTDSSTPVRHQLLKLLRVLPVSDVGPHVEKILMYVRGGMTHLADEIRSDALAVLEWLLEVAGSEAVSCPGGWMKTLKSFSSILGWNPAVGSAMSSNGWTSSTKTAFVAKGGPLAQARQIQVLAKFLQVGFRPETVEPHDPKAYWDNIYRLPRSSNPFAYLNLSGPSRDEDGDMYPDRSSRMKVFEAKWAESIVSGMQGAKKEGGAPGRAAALLDQVFKSAFVDGVAA